MMAPVGSMAGLANVERFVSDFARPQYPWPDSLGRERFVDFPAADGFNPQPLNPITEDHLCCRTRGSRPAEGMSFTIPLGPYMIKISGRLVT